MQECLRGVSSKVLARALGQAPLHSGWRAAQPSFLSLLAVAAGSNLPSALEMACLELGALTPKPVTSLPGAPGAGALTPKLVPSLPGDPGVPTLSGLRMETREDSGMLPAPAALSTELAGFLGGGRCCGGQEGSGVWPVRRWAGAVPGGPRSIPRWHGCHGTAGSQCCWCPVAPGTGMQSWIQETRPAHRERRCLGEPEQQRTPPHRGTSLRETQGQPAPHAPASPCEAQPSCEALGWCCPTPCWGLNPKNSR